jgi:cephalosporin-C deacetylase-like acetyl esterase
MPSMKSYGMTNCRQPSQMRPAGPFRHASTMGTTARTDVEFPGFGGVTLRGWLYRPAGPDPAPAVVMAHGFSATRHMGLPAFADDLTAAGFAVLLYDHRNLGDSDGDPRQEINPWAQAGDLGIELQWRRGDGRGCG